MKLLGRSKKDVDQNKDGEDVPKLEFVKIVLVHCNLVNKNYQQASKVLSTFVTKVTITPHSTTMVKTTNAEISFIKVWFTDQNNRVLEIEDNVNIALMMGTG